MTTGLPLMKSVLTPPAKNGSTIWIISSNLRHMQLFKKNHASGITALIISNVEMEDIMKIVKSLEESRLLMKGISETIKNETKEQKERLGTLAASLLGSALTGKGVITAGEGVIRAGGNFNATPSFT